MTAPRRCLLIADLRHASPRWPALAGGLIAKGWEVTVVTAPLRADASEELGFPRIFAERARIVECGSATDALEPVRNLLWLFGLRRKQSLTEQLKAQLPAAGTRSAFDVAFQTLLSLIGWPDLQAPWRRPALRAARELMREQTFDVLVSSSPYPTSHAVAAALKRENPQLRWVADFRDLWSQNHNYAMPLWRQRVDNRLERRMIAGADALVTTAHDWADTLRREHGKPVTVVRNSFVDYEAPADAAPPALAPLIVLYSGVRYPRQQHITPVLEAVAALKNGDGLSPADVQLRFIGPHDAELDHEATRLGVSAFVRQDGAVPRAAAQRLQREAHVLLYMQWEDPAVDMVSSLKFWEYLGSGRPVLMTGGHAGGTAEAIAIEAQAGTVAHTPTEIADALRRWIAELKSSGAVASHLRREVTAPYGATARALELAQVLSAG